LIGGRGNDDEGFPFLATFDLREAFDRSRIGRQRVQAVDGVGGKENEAAGADQLDDFGNLRGAGLPIDDPALHVRARTRFGRAPSRSSRAAPPADCATVSRPSMRATSATRSSS